jgi:2-methylcitrate dehydratase PrpD
MIPALDYDDVHEGAVTHSGVITIPTVMAVAEQKGNLGKYREMAKWVIA